MWPRHGIADGGGGGGPCGGVLLRGAADGRRGDAVERSRALTEAVVGIKPRCVKSRGVQIGGWRVGVEGDRWRR